MNSGAAGQLSVSFAAALGGAAKPLDAPASLLGLEHEYRLSADGRSLDFSELIHDLPVRGRRLDPGDRNAYRCASGLALTCDDAEAEVACPPVDVRPGFARAIQDWAVTGRAELREVLPAGIELNGHSTHLSASMPGTLNERACQLFGRTFAPVLSLLVDGPDSFGVYVRPRPGRLEFCGEYVVGPRLTAAAAFVAGAARACADTVNGDAEAIRRMPPTLAARLAPAHGRYGLYLGRRKAFGFDLYQAGRRAELPRRGGGTITAQEQLELAWTAARASLGGNANAGDLEAAGRIVEGSLALGTEERATSDNGEDFERQHSAVYGGVVAPRRRPGFGVATVIATWDFTVFRVEGPGRAAYACVPRDCLASFLDRLDHGALDEVIGRYLASPATGRLLGSHGQTRAPGLWDELGDMRELLAPERQPVEWAGVSGPGETDPASKFARPGKIGRPGKALLVAPGSVRPGRRPLGGGPTGGPPPPGARPSETGGGPTWKFILPLVAAAGAVLIGVGVILGGGSSGGDGASSPTPTAGHTSTPTPTATIAVVAPTSTRTGATTPAATLTPTPMSTPIPTPAASPTPTPAPGVVCDLTIGMTSLPSNPGGGLISYVVQVEWDCPTNGGPDTSDPVIIHDALPLRPPPNPGNQAFGFTSAPQVVASGSGSGIGCSGPPAADPGGAPGFDTNRFVCNLGELAANGVAEVRYTLDVGAGQDLLNTVVVDVIDAIQENDEANNQAQTQDLNCCP